MKVLTTLRRLWWRKQKAGWLVRSARFVGRSRKVALFAGVVALFGGAREAQKRFSHS